MSALARWCFRHRFAVIAAWVLVLVGLGALAQAVKSDYNNSFSLPGTDSTTAQQLLARAVPAQAGDSDTIVWQVSRGTVRDPAVVARMSQVLRNVATMPEVTAVASPYRPGGSAQISRDGRIAYATVDFAQQADNLAPADVNRVVNAAESAREPELNVQLGGQAIENTEQAPPGTSVTIGVLAAAAVLFIAFGSLLAMVLPIVTAIAGVGGGLMAIAPLTHAISVVDIAPILGTLIGLGVGIDYALFIVTRHRRGMLAGLAPEQAAVKAIDTSGRAVLFAGSTVCIALLGILILGIGFLSGLAVASALTVVFTVFAVAAGVVMLVLAIPVLSLRLGTSDRGNDPSSTTTRQAYDLLADGFGPGFNGPLQLVAQTRGPADVAVLRALEASLPGVPDVTSVTPLAAAHGTEVIQVTPGTSPEAKATSDLITTLRNTVIPEAERGTTLRVYVGGVTATFADFAAVVSAKMPWFILATVGLSFLLLVVAFRSLLIPATAAVMNLLAAAATIMICVFLTFSFMGQRDLAEFGIGLAAAVALDAFILRTVLVPAAMHLFGNANWWLPRWLDRRLPHLAIEPTEAGPAVPAPLTHQGALR